MEVWLDGTNVFTQNAKQINTTLNAAPGAHEVAVFGYKSDGSFYKRTVQFSVR
jgi:hypothetical protein